MTVGMSIVWAFDVQPHAECLTGCMMSCRYFTNPLIIRGPGAGAEVTAGGVFSDLLRLAAFLDGPS